MGGHVGGNTQEEASAGPQALRMQKVGATGWPESLGRGLAGAAVPKAPVVLGGPGGGEVGRPGRRLGAYLSDIWQTGATPYAHHVYYRIFEETRHSW